MQPTLYPYLVVGIKIKKGKFLQILADLFLWFVYYKCETLERGSVGNHLPFYI